MADFMGPPDPTVYPPRQVEGRPYDEPDASIKDLWPIMLGQLLDLGSTAAMDGKPLPGGRIGVEKNPLPGMKSNVGRVGWSLAELLATHFLTKNKPKLRDAWRGTRPAVSAALAMNNFGMAQGRDVAEMVMSGKALERP